MEQVLELLVTCLACGEQWSYALPGTLAACLSLFTKHRLPIDRCPICGAQEAIFKRRDHCGPTTS